MPLCLLSLLLFLLLILVIPLPAILSSSGLFRKHYLSRRADPQQPGRPVASEWGKDSGDEPPADRPS